MYLQGKQFFSTPCSHETLEQDEICVSGSEAPRSHKASLFKAHAQVSCVLVQVCQILSTSNMKTLFGPLSVHVPTGPIKSNGPKGPTGLSWPAIWPCGPFEPSAQTCTVLQVVQGATA